LGTKLQQSLQIVADLSMSEGKKSKKKTAKATTTSTSPEEDNPVESHKEEQQNTKKDKKGKKKHTSKQEDAEENENKSEEEEEEEEKEKDEENEENEEKLDEKDAELLQHIKDKTEKTIAKIIQFHEEGEGKAGEEFGWRQAKVKKGVYVHVKHEEGDPLTSAKARGIVPGTADLMLRLLQSLDYYPQIDPLYKDGYVYKKFPDGQHEIIYAPYSSGFDLIVSPRDFCYAEGRRDTPEGGKRIAAFSIDHEAIPPVKGHVRAWIYYSGWIINPCQPTEEQLIEAGLQDVKSEYWCETIFVAQVDIKGWIPLWLVNHMCVELGDAIHRLRKFLKDKSHLLVEEEQREKEKGKGKGKGKGKDGDNKKGKEKTKRKSQRQVQLNQRGKE
jgi:hypothetical protein